MFKHIVIAACLTVVSLLLLTANASAEIPLNGLIGRWNLDGNATDLSGAGNHGTVVSAVPAQDRAGNLNGCYHYDGNNDRIDCGDGMNSVALPVSIVAWIRRTGSSTVWRGIFYSDQNVSKHSGFKLQHKGSRLSVSYGTGNGFTSTHRRNKDRSGVIPSDEWVHVAGVMTGYNDMQLYVNGQDVGGSFAGSAASMSHTAGDPIVIGRGSETNWFDGWIDDVLVYDRALSPAEIMDIYESSKPDSACDYVTVRKISATSGNLTGPLDDSDAFGVEMAAIGDLDDDGVIDLVVGAASDGDGEIDAGAVYVLFLDSTGAVIDEQKISSVAGSLGISFVQGEHFGSDVAALGDLDGDGVEDIVVGAPGTDPPAVTGKGAVYVLLLNLDGTVKSATKISDGEGGFTGVLQDGDEFGYSVACLGDVDGDSIPDIAVGAIRDGNTGSAYVLLMNSNGTVKSHTKIASGSGGFVGSLSSGDFFGDSVSPVGDLNDDGVPDLVVGATFDDTAAPNGGAIWICFLDSAGQVIADHRVTSNVPAFDGVLNEDDTWGASISFLGDYDSDGFVDLAVGANGDDDGGAPLLANRGAVHVLSFDSAGEVVRSLTISDTAGCFGGSIDDGDGFGHGTAALGDLNGDGIGDLAVGAIGDDDGGPNRGAAYILFLGSPPPIPTSTALGSEAREPIGSLRVFPNPFNPTTLVSFHAPARASVDLEVYDLRGRLVKTLLSGSEVSGQRTINWDGSTNRGTRAASGAYFVRLVINGSAETHKVMLLK